MIYVASVNAQAPGKKKSNNTFSLGAVIALPVGIFADIYSIGIGISAQENFSISKNTALTLSAAYNHFFFKSIYGKGGFDFIPVLAGAELNITPKVFASGQLGLTFYTEGGGKAFTYAPGLGFKLSKSFSAILKYVGRTSSGINSGTVGLRLAYNFHKEEK